MKVLSKNLKQIKIDNFFQKISADILNVFM